jgi:hypothetical protein
MMVVVMIHVDMMPVTHAHRGGKLRRRVIKRV